MCLLWSVLLLCVLKKFWYKLTGDGEMIVLKHVVATLKHVVAILKHVVAILKHVVAILKHAVAT